jgi:hypothetical protein
LRRAQTSLLTRGFDTSFGLSSDRCPRRAGWRRFRQVRDLRSGASREDQARLAAIPPAMLAAGSGGASIVRVVGSGADNHDASWRAKCPTPRRWRTRRHGPASASPNRVSGRAVGLDRRQRNSEQIRQFFLDFENCLGPFQATPKLGVFPLHPCQFRHQRSGVAQFRPTPGRGERAEDSDVTLTAPLIADE